MTRIDALLDAARRKLGPYRPLIEGEAPEIGTVTLVIQLDRDGRAYDVFVRTEGRKDRHDGRRLPQKAS